VCPDLTIHTTVRMVKVISSEELRLRLTQLATEVQKTGTPIDVHPIAGQPQYQVASATALDPQTVRTCVRVGPDWFRRHMSEVRGLALFDDIPFGLTIRGQLVAVFQRHPEYRPLIVDQVRAKFASLRGASSPDLTHRISALEAAVEALKARLDNQPTPIRPTPIRPTPIRPTPMRRRNPSPEK
jgi:hypothetical protein